LRTGETGLFRGRRGIPTTHSITLLDNCRKQAITLTIGILSVMAMLHQLSSWLTLLPTRTTHYNSTVRRPLAKVFLLIGMLISTSPAFSQPSSKVETMAGRIVAYSNRLTCLNGNAYWSMLIHLQDHARDFSSQFVEVGFSLPCDKSPEWLTHKPSLKKFRLRRDQDADSVLKQFVDCATASPDGHTAESCPHMPRWKSVPGAEHEKLPFGQRVPSYRSVDLPLAPVV
jgi:hypothetical protein